MRFIKRQFVQVWLEEAKREECAVDLQYFAGYQNHQQFWHWAGVGWGGGEECMV